jgi:hypothetical protein
MTESETSLDRPEAIRKIVAPDAIGILEQPLTVWERAWNNAALREVALLIVLASAWEIYARWLNNPPQSEITNRQGAKNAKSKWLIGQKGTTLLKAP